MPTELPEALKRSTKEYKVRENKKHYGENISNRPEIASLRIEVHWEGDTVVGTERKGLFLLLEKKTEIYLAFRIPGKTREAIMEAMKALRCEYGTHFVNIFKTITVDNGSEFADFAQVATWGTDVYFAHPCSSWERPQNERHNGIFRAFVPEGVCIEQDTDEEILAATDELNGKPRRKLGYHTPEKLLNRYSILSRQPNGRGNLAHIRSLRLQP